MKNKYKNLWAGFTFSILISISSSVAHAEPAQIVVFRHAEKIDDQHPGLSENGSKRADLLPEFFAKNTLLSQFGAPVALFAMEPKSEEHSQRSILTLTPLAKKLGLTIQADVERDHYKKLIKKILSNEAYQGRTVVICWQHAKIDNIVKELGYQGELKVRGKYYDRMWVIQMNVKPAKFTDLAMRLLPGDSE